MAKNKFSIRLLKSLILGFLILPLLTFGQSSIEGCYKNSDSYKIKNGKEIQVSIDESRLGIKAISNNSYQISYSKISGVSAGGRSCYLNGTALLRNANHQGDLILDMVTKVEDFESAESAKCKLSFVITKNKITSEIAGDCTSHFLCGVGIDLGSIQFNRANKVTDNKTTWQCIGLSTPPIEP